MNVDKLTAIMAVLALGSGWATARAAPVLPFATSGSIGADLPTIVDSAPVTSIVFNTDAGTYTATSTMGSQTFSGGMLESAGSNSDAPANYMVYNFGNITVNSGTTVSVAGSLALVLTASNDATINGTINMAGAPGTPGGFGTGAAASLSGGGGGAGGGAVLLLAGNTLTVGPSAGILAQGG